MICRTCGEDVDDFMRHLTEELIKEKKIATDDNTQVARLRSQTSGEGVAPGGSIQTPTRSRRRSVTGTNG